MSSMVFGGSGDQLCFVTVNFFKFFVQLLHFTALPTNTEVSCRVHLVRCLQRLHGYEIGFSPNLPFILLQNTNCWSLELTAL